MNSYCSKSKTQYTLECMRNRRSRSRADEISRIIYHEENEDVAMDVPHTVGQAHVDGTDDPAITTIDHSKCIGAEFSDESEINGDDDVDDDIEVESDDDDIEDFLNLYDLNNQTKLFPSSPLSVRDACFIIIKLARRLNLNKNGIKHLLNGIRNLLPLDAKLPHTVKGLMKIIGMYKALCTTP